MADYEMAYLLTDSAQRYFDKDDKEAVEVVKTANIPADEIGEYSPFALFYMKGEVCTRNGFTVKEISGDTKSITIDGFTKRGIIPLFSKETFSVGDVYTADGIFTVSSDGSSRSEGSVVITDIVLCKNENDIEDILNAMQKLGTQFGRKIKMAEQVIDDDGLLMEAESEDFDLEEYMEFMAEVGVSSYPQERMFRANV